MKFSVTTLGCKTNQSESDRIIRELVKTGHEYSGIHDDTDIHIVNTCTVTQTTDKKTRQAIRKILREKKPTSRIIVTGCYVRFNRPFLEGLGINHIIENPRKEYITGLVNYLSSKDNDHVRSKNPEDLVHARPFIKIQDGCSQHCAYCIVPKVRGPYNSIEEQKIINEINEAVGLGYGEVVLTGIHIGKYGVDTDSSLSDLCKKILKETDIERVRFSSLEVNELDDSLISLIEDNIERIAPHFHIPLQSGSDRILDLMSRPYSSEQFSKKVKRLSAIKERTAITTDIIVGFPTEEIEDFKNTYLLVKSLPISRLHVFKYSPRKYTRAYSMDGKVSDKVKKDRVKRLIDLGKIKRESFISANIEKTLDAVIERYDQDLKLFTGTSGNYIRVYLDARDDIPVSIGKITKVRASAEYRDGLKVFIINNG